MQTTPNLGLTVWNLSTDPYSHTQLANNWTILDNFSVQPAKSIQLVSNLNAGTVGGPASPLNSGALVVTNTSVGGFPAWTMLEYNGSSWAAVGPVEVQSSVPNTNLYTGRTVFLTNAASNFIANTLITYNGSSWNYVGPLSLAFTGSGALNINGVQTAGDVYVNSGSRGLVLVDRSTTLLYRIFMNNGSLAFEQVS